MNAYNLLSVRMILLPILLVSLIGAACTPTEEGE